MRSAQLRSAVIATLLMAIFGYAFVLLGQWQWRNAFLHEQTPGPVISNRVQALDLLSKPESWLPRTSIGARTSATGTLLVDQGFGTAARPTTRGEHPWWVTPLRLSDGSVLAVATAVAPRSTAKQQNVIGRLQPSEDSPAIGAWTPAVAELTTPGLVDRWPFPVVRDGYLLVTQGEPGEPLPVARFTSAPSGSIGWRNIAYALQWWSFALFAVFVWWRHVTGRDTPTLAD